MRKGQSLVEFLIAIGLTSIFMPALITGLVSSREGKAQQNERLMALNLLKESQEAIRIIHEAGWNNFRTNGTFHPVLSGATWSLAPGEESVNGFTRKVEVSDIRRDENGNIVPSGGYIDPSTKKAETTVSWGTPIPSSITSTNFISRFIGNSVLSQTSDSDFNSGFPNNTIVTNTSGGEVTLATGGHGNWCKPFLTLTEKDLPKSGVANAISAYEGRIFAGTGENAAGVSFANVTIDNNSPPNATISGTIDGFKTNDLFGETNYAYIATDNNKEEIAIINLSTQPFLKSGYFNAPGNGNGSSVYVAGNTGYMTSGNNFYNFDLSAKTGARDLIDADGVALTGNGTNMVIQGNFAYVSSDSTDRQLQIIDISNQADLQIVGYAQLDGLGATSIAIDDLATRAYVVTRNSASKKEFFVIDITVKTGSRPTMGSYDSNGMSPLAVGVVPGNKAVMGGTGGEEYQVLEIADEANITRCGGLNIDTGVRGISTVIESDDDSFAYVITGDASTELKMIEGGPGGKHSSSGDFTSSAIDANQEVAFNRFKATVSQPIGTTLTFQVAGADTGGAGNDCAGAVYSFVGPNGTASTYFSATGPSIEGTVPLNDDGSGYENPARCFKYKAYFNTTSSLSTPVLYDFILNYSP